MKEEIPTIEPYRELWKREEQDNKELREIIEYKDQKIERLSSIIKEAREYIENNQLYFEDYDYDIDDEMYLAGIDDKQASEDLINILKGSENNE